MWWMEQKDFWLKTASFWRRHNNPKAMMRALGMVKLCNSALRDCLHN